MELIQLSYFLFIGVFFGLTLTFLWDFLERRVLFRRIKIEAKHILEDAQEIADETIDLSKKECEKKNENKLYVFEKEKDILNSNIQSIEGKINNKRNTFKTQIKKSKIYRNKNQSNIIFLREEKKRIIKEKKTSQSSLQDYQNKRVEELKKRIPFQTEVLKEEVKKELKEDWKDYVKKKLFVEKINLEDRQSLKKSADFYLNLALNRFQRSYCSERGIPSVKFKSKRHLELTVGENRNILNN